MVVLAWRGMLSVALLGTALLAGTSGAQAQSSGSPALVGTITGTVVRCVNAAEQPLPGVRISESTGLASTVADPHGQFLLSLPPGQYTLLVGDSAATAYAVAVAANQDTPIGTLGVGGNVAGCGGLVAPVVPSTAAAASVAAAQAVIP